jgi:hypothetical protein
MSLRFVIVYFSDFWLLTPVVGLLYLYRSLTTGQKAFFGYCLILLIVELFTIYLAHRYRQNLWLYNVYFVVEAITLAIFFQKIFQNSFVRKLVLYVGLGIALVNSTLVELQNMSDGGWINCFFTIICCLYFLWETLNKISPKPVTSEPMFWIVTGFLLYASSTYFIYLFKHLVFIHDNEMAKHLSLARIILFITRNALFLIGIWQIGASKQLKNIFIITSLASIVLSVLFSLK